jgi:iron(III) transport system ATP-binding protein
VAQNIVFGLPRALRKARHKVAEMLDLVGLPMTYADRPPQYLSGGEQQRVALARALAPGPALVLLDEPFSSLDAALRVETREAVTKALAAAGATALLVTHDQAEALSLGRQVAVLRGGRFVQVAEPRDLYRRPVDRATAQFVGEAVIVPGEIRDGRAICLLGDLTLVEPASEGRADLMIRPEQIRLLGNAHNKGFMARVVTVVFYGHEARVELLSIDTDPSIALTARTFSHLSPEPGNRVRVEVDGPVKAFSRSAAEQTGTTVSEKPVTSLEQTVVFT